MTDEETNEIEVNEMLDLVDRVIDNIDRMLASNDELEGAAQRRERCAGHPGPAVIPARPGERASLRLGSACTYGVGA